jgi:hypothetical protein
VQSRHHDQVPATHNERRRWQRLGTTIKYLRRATSCAAGNGLSATIKYLRRTTSFAAGNGLGTTIKYLRGAVDNGLGTTIKYLRGAAGIGLGTTAKYLRRTASGAAGIGLGTTIKYLRRTVSGAAGNGLGRCRGLLMCAFTTSAPNSPCFARASFSPTSKTTLSGPGFRCPVFVCVCVWGPSLPAVVT